MSTVAATLRAARALIDEPEKWCQGVPTNDDKQCAVTALCAVESGCTGTALGFLTRALPAEEREVTRFNDWHTHAEVLALFDRAIAEAEAQP